MQQLREQARELEEQQKGMKKKVNPKVLNMIDRYVLFSTAVTREAQMWTWLT